MKKIVITLEIDQDHVTDIEVYEYLKELMDNESLDFQVIDSKKQEKTT